MQRFIAVILLFFILFFYYGTVLSGNLTANSQLIHQNVEKIYWIPFLDCYEGDLLSPLDMFQNILFFVPFGFL